MKVIQHKRRSWTSPGPDPYAMTSHRWTSPAHKRISFEVKITDGPALVADLYLTVGRRTRKVFISESVHPWVYPIIERLFLRAERQHQIAERAREADYDGYDDYRAYR